MNHLIRYAVFIFLLVQVYMQTESFALCCVLGLIYFEIQSNNITIWKALGSTLDAMKKVVLR